MLIYIRGGILLSTELIIGFESVKYVVFEGTNRSVDVCLTKSASFSGNITLFLFAEEGSASGRQYTIHTIYFSLCYHHIAMNLHLHLQLVWTICL